MAESENPGEGTKRAALSRKAVEGGVWVIASRFSTQFLAFAKLIVLARILSPDDFGIMGIALMVVAVAERFSQTGLPQALIQKPLIYISIGGGAGLVGNSRFFDTAIRALEDQDVQVIISTGMRTSFSRQRKEPSQSDSSPGFPEGP